jgi:peptide-methionine (R)-S-oxide reductase
MAKQYSNDKLKKKLTPEQYHILREGGTETPFSGKYVNHSEQGMYTCAVCGTPLFSSDTKFESKAAGLTGWPSFSDVAKSDAVKLTDDNSLGMHRVEITCATCGSHLGHLFEDVPGEDHTKHYCINSACLDFEPKS